MGLGSLFFAKITTFLVRKFNILPALLLLWQFTFSCKASTRHVTLIRFLHHHNLCAFNDMWMTNLMIWTRFILIENLFIFATTAAQCYKDAYVSMLESPLPRCCGLGQEIGKSFNNVTVCFQLPQRYAIFTHAGFLNF